MSTDSFGTAAGARNRVTITAVVGGGAAAALCVLYVMVSRNYPPLFSTWLGSAAPFFNGVLAAGATILVPWICADFCRTLGQTAAEKVGRIIGRTNFWVVDGICAAGIVIVSVPIFIWTIHCLETARGYADELWAERMQLTSRLTESMERNEPESMQKELELQLDAVTRKIQTLPISSERRLQLWDKHSKALAESTAKQIALMFTPPPCRGCQLIRLKNVDVWYPIEVNPQMARQVAVYLEEKLGPANLRGEAIGIKLTKVGEVYEIRLPLREGVDLEEARSKMRLMSPDLGLLLGKGRAEIHLCDTEFKTRAIVFE